MKKQSNIFLDNEANNWFQRNNESVKLKNYATDDFIIAELSEMEDVFKNKRVLEIGASDGSRLQYLKDEFCCDVYGIDPSSDAVASGLKNGLNLKVGLASELEFEPGFFDVVIFGFCLYLCDRDDLFKIASEVDRVTKNNSWVVILDFFTKGESVNNYSHCSGVLSYKFDNRKMFEWHPAYTCVVHKVKDHTNYSIYTDNKDDWMAVSIIRKKYG